MKRLLFSLLFLVTSIGMIHCGKDTPIVVQSETALALIGAAVQASQGVGTLTRAEDRSLPASTVVCPTFATTDTATSACLAQNSNTFGTAPGEYLWRAMIFCQSAGPTNPGWWRAYHHIKFPSQTICNNVKASPTGITSANVTALGLVGQTIELHYGNGIGGDNDSMRFAQNGEVTFLYSDFESGWLEIRNGGTTVTYSSASERSVQLKGIHAKNYVTLYGNIRPPAELYADYRAKAEAGAVEPSSAVLTKQWDRTVASQMLGDRLFTSSDENADTRATATSTLSVQWESNVPVAKAGAIFRTQENARRSIGVSTIKTDLKYGDPNCCWPTEGELSTTFSAFFNLPSASDKAFTQEVLTFTAGATCGTATVTQSGGELGSKASSVELVHCM